MSVYYFNPTTGEKNMCIYCISVLASAVSKNEFEKSNMVHPQASMYFAERKSLLEKQQTAYWTC